KSGIEPDIVFELSDEQRKDLQKNRDKVGTLDDAQYAKAFDILVQEIAAKQGSRAERKAR
ncbi:MAG: peptidase S41, partial [Moorea sp. SIO4A3]|nr:peptidase S41 [Moorena sp. SIO4A3]